MDSFLDEAKSMFQVGTYHNHIVNLQGITVGVGEDDGKLSEVSLSSFVFKINQNNLIITNSGNNS